MDPLGITGLLTSQIAIGGIIGFFIGYAIKKITKLAIIIFGIFLLALVYLEYNGFITINYERFQESFGEISRGMNERLLIPTTPILTNLPILGGFGLGFLVGLKKG